MKRTNFPKAYDNTNFKKTKMQTLLPSNPETTVDHIPTTTPKINSSANSVMSPQVKKLSASKLGIRQKPPSAKAMINKLMNS
jgi:hypothetical protein